MVFTEQGLAFLEEYVNETDVTLKLDRIACPSCGRILDRDLECSNYPCERCGIQWTHCASRPARFRAMPEIAPQ